MRPNLRDEEFTNGKVMIGDYYSVKLDYFKNDLVPLRNFDWDVSDNSFTDSDGTWSHDRRNHCLIR